MTKDELKTGMIVRYRNGTLRVVMRNDIYDEHNSNLVGTDGWAEFHNFNDDLTSCIHPNYDIVTIYGISHMSYVNIFSGDCKLDDSFVMDYGHLLWEREEPVVEMTIKEIEEKLGTKNLKIIEE